MLKKGLFGCDLKHQVGAIGFLYSALSVLAIIFGFVLIQHPQYFADGALKASEEMEDKLEARAIQENADNEIIDDINEDYGSEEEERMDYEGSIEGDDSLDSEEIEYPDEHRGPIETTDDSLESEEKEQQEMINPKVCSGDDSECCTPEAPCGVDEGDCDSDDDCEEGLVCGTDNCSRDSVLHCCQLQTTTDLSEHSEKNETKKIEMENVTSESPEITDKGMDNEEHFDLNAEIIGDNDDSEEENNQNETSNTMLDIERVKREADYRDGMEINADRNSSDPEEDDDLSDGRKHYNLLLKFLRKEGVEVVVASLLKLSCSILLIMGVSQGKSWFLVPWLVEECLEMVAGLLQAMVSAAHSSSWTVSGGVMFVLLYMVGGYCMYSVASYHGILRRMNAHSREIISSVSQGGFQSRMNYQRLEEECWQSQPNIVHEFRETGPGFVREKKVDMDDNDDHVLYVQ